MVGPYLHTQKGLRVEEVVQIILNERKLFQQQLSSIEVGIVLYVSNEVQGIVYQFYHTVIGILLDTPSLTVILLLFYYYYYYYCNRT